MKGGQHPGYSWPRYPVRDQQWHRYQLASCNPWTTGIQVAYIPYTGYY
jgi:hypothetical protein